MRCGMWSACHGRPRKSRLRAAFSLVVSNEKSHPRVAFHGHDGWRRGRDSNPRWGLAHTRFPGVRLKPLIHLSAKPAIIAGRRTVQVSSGLGLDVCRSFCMADTDQRRTLRSCCRARSAWWWHRPPPCHRHPQRVRRPSAGRLVRRHGCRIAAAMRSMAWAVASATAVMAAASALRRVDGGLLFALGAGDESLTLAGGDVDLFLAATFGGSNQGALSRARR